jgi:hypothetical protein
MKNKTALILSIALTAFLLVLAGGVVTTVRASQQKKAETQLQAVAQSTVQDQGLDPNLQQALSDREAGYQQLIADANARLQQAEQQQQALQAQIAALQAQQTPAAPVAAQVTTVTPQQAAQIASSYMGNKDVYSVETADYNGETVYLVTLSSGGSVYVSLSGGVVNVKSAPVVTMNTRSGGHEDDHHKEHEGSDD